MLVNFEQVNVNWVASFNQSCMKDTGALLRISFRCLFYTFELIQKISPVFVLSNFRKKMPAWHFLKQKAEFVISETLFQIASAKKFHVFVWKT